MHMEPPPPPTGPTPPYTSSTSSTHPADSSHPTNQQKNDQQQQQQQAVQQQQQQQPSRYEAQKRRDWNTFQQYLRNHKPPLALARCSGAHVIEFLKYLDQFGKTKVHANNCPFFGNPNPPSSCACPLKQAWGSLDALIGRLRAAYEESGGRPESNPFAARAVRIYLREVRESQAHARGIPYEKKKRKRVNSPASTTGARAGAGVSSSSSSGAGAAGAGGEGGSSTSGVLRDQLGGAPT